MSVITVRTATPNDLPELTRLWHEKTVIQQQFDHRFTLSPDGDKIWAVAVEGWMTDANCAVFVAERDNRLLGYVIGCIETAPPGLFPETIGTVLDMVVDSHGQPGGLGKSLLAALCEWFVANGIASLVAHVPHRGMVEQAFWRAQGATDWVDRLWMKL